MKQGGGVTHLLHEREHLLDLGAREDGREACAYLPPLGLAGEEEIEGSHLVVPHIALGKPIGEADKVLHQHGSHQLQVADEQRRLMKQVDAHHGLIAEAIVEVEAAQLQGERLLQLEHLLQVAQYVRRLHELDAAPLPVDVGATRPDEHRGQ